MLLASAGSPRTLQLVPPKRHGIPQECSQKQFFGVQECTFKMCTFKIAIERVHVQDCNRKSARSRLQVKECNYKIASERMQVQECISRMQLWMRLRMQFECISECTLNAICTRLRRHCCMQLECNYECNLHAVPNAFWIQLECNCECMLNAMPNALLM